MPVYFEDHFNAHAEGEYPDGWTVEQHADLAHPLGEVRGDGYWLKFAGNKHLPAIPPLRNFILTFRVNADAYSTALGVFIFFRYDPGRREGYCVRYDWGKTGIEAVLGIYRNGNFTTLSKAAVAEPAFPVGAPAESSICPEAQALKGTPVESSIRLEVQDRQFRLWHNNVCVAKFEDAKATFDASGLIAFDRPGCIRGSYALTLGAVRIESDETVPESTLWPERKIEFPMQINGMTSPFYYSVEAVRSGEHVVLKTALTGGPAERQPDDYCARDFFANARLCDPYIRLECRGERALGPFYLFRGSVGLKEHWHRLSTGFLPADIECPLRETMILPEQIEEMELVIGYAHYAAEDRLTLEGGPSEAFVNPRTGAIDYAGAALRPGDVNVEIESPTDKQICARLPKDDVRHEQALEFARQNHYFFESEPARFRILVRHRAAELETGPLTARVQLENVFREPVGMPLDIPLRPLMDTQADRLKQVAGIVTLATEFIALPKLDVGVYHLRAALMHGSALTRELCKAFEVLAEDPAAPCPPLASGLPDLIPCLPDYETEAAGFDPWVGRGVDSAHYLANTCFHPLVARRDKIWDGVHLYRRKWMLEMAPRMIKPTAFEPNRDLLRHCDLLYMYNRKDLWKQETYKGKAVLAVLLRFLRSPESQLSANSALTPEAVEREQKLTDAMFHELLSRHWKAWLTFYNRWNAEECLSAQRAELAAINPKAQLMSYSLYPPYGSTYKSAYFTLYAGHDLRNKLERFWDGPLLLEDYPYMCGYPLQRGVFMLAAMKLEAPRLRHYPEVYDVSGCASDGRPVFGLPPYGSECSPSGYIRKTVFEYSYGAVWFDEAGFHYWDDRGFQATCWSSAHFEELLKAWPIVVRHRPLKPLRTAAFCYSREACLAHPDYYTGCRGNADFGGCGEVPDDMINTAEEAVAFAYEQARLDGQSAGFVAALEHVGRLAPEDVHTLVLPPLCGVAPETLAAIRRLHERGVALLGFEDVTGLEDLFGVAAAPAAETVKEIYIAETSDNPLKQMSVRREKCETDICTTRYRLAGGVALLEGTGVSGRTVPVLVTHRTKGGSTALFTIPPTLVRRSDLKHLVAYGKESISRLINAATALILRELGQPAVETTAGKLIAFQDQAGDLHIIVEEDAWPVLPVPITPVVTIRQPGLQGHELICDKAVSVLETSPDLLKIRLDLNPHESAHLHIILK